MRRSLPGAFQNVTTYSASIPTSAKEIDAAKSADQGADRTGGRWIYKAKGLEPGLSEDRRHAQALDDRRGLLRYSAVRSVHAADINAFVSTAVKSATDEILPGFERANGQHHPGEATRRPAPLVPRFLRGEPVDIFITDAPALDELIKQGKIAGGRVDLVRTGIGIAVMKGAEARRLDAGGAQARAAQCKEHRPPRRPRAAASPAAMCSGCSGELGIADEVTPKVKLSMGGPNSRVSVLVSSGQAEIGLQQASELYDNPDVEVIGMLPRAPCSRRRNIPRASRRAPRSPKPAKAMIQALDRHRKPKPSTRPKAREPN